MLVEGAGGLLVPLAPDGAWPISARALALPLLVVARASLGTVNHTLLTLEAARGAGSRRRRRLLAHRAARRTRRADQPRRDRHATASVAILGTLPRLESSDPATLADAAEHHLALDRLLERL